MHAIALRNVTKTYEGNPGHALSNVDLDVDSGELVLMMGPSGSGKTTLLSIMGCILRASSGSVRIRDTEVTGLGEKDLPRVRLNHMGFVFQGFNLFSTLTVQENVELVLDLKGIGGWQARRRAGEILDRVGMLPKGNAYPAELSGGQKQRVAIARSLVSNPEIILADEPTASLDSSSGRCVMELLRDFAHQQSRAVVVVTHDKRTLEFADRIIHIEDGRIGGLHEAKAHLFCS